MSGHPAPCYANIVIGEAEAVAEEAEKRKRAKYAHFDATHVFVPSLVYSVLGVEARSVFRELRYLFFCYTLEPLAHNIIYLLRRLAIAMQQLHHHPWYYNYHTYKSPVIFIIIII